MIARALALIALLALAWVVVGLIERRRGGGPSGIPSGLTIVTGANCRLCPVAVAAAGETGVPVTVVDVGDLAGHGIRSLPTALVTDVSGAVLARRSGRSVISDMSTLAELARAAG